MRLKMRPIWRALIALLAACSAPPGAQTPGLLGGLFGDEAIIAADLMPYGFPGTEMLRYRKGYVLSYDAARRVPRWVAERLDSVVQVAAPTALVAGRLAPRRDGCLLCFGPAVPTVGQSRTTRFPDVGVPRRAA